MPMMHSANTCKACCQQEMFFRESSCRYNSCLHRTKDYSLLDKT